MRKFLTNRQISIILYFIIFGYNTRRLPKDIAENAGTASWLLLLMATVIFILITYIITFLQYIHEGKTIVEYSKQLIGKFITYIFLALYLIYYFIALAISVRGASETFKSNTLNKTPSFFIGLLFYIAIAYALIRGINAIARICEIYAPIIILGYIFLFFVLATQGRLVNIRPLFVVEDILICFKALPSIVTVFLGMEILLFIPISRSHNKHILKYTVLMVGFIGVLYIYMVESIISVAGTELVVRLEAPMLSVLKGVDIYNLEFIRRLDGIYNMLRLANLFCTFSIFSYGIAVIIKSVLGKIKYNVIAVMIILISIILSQIPRTVLKIDLILKYNSYLGIAVTVVIPVILFIITKVKKYDKKTL